MKLGPQIPPANGFEVQGHVDSHHSHIYVHDSIAPHTQTSFLPRSGHLEHAWGLLSS
jgi:hypothetical protein